MRLNGHKFWKTVAIVLFFAGLAGEVWSLAIWENYFDMLPRSPDLRAGRTIPDDNFHGFVLYESSAEHFRLYAVEYSSEAMLFLGFLIGAILEWKNRKTRSGALLADYQRNQRPPRNHRWGP